MPQTWLQWLRGYAHLTADTLSQSVYDKLFVKETDAIFHDKDYLKDKVAIVTGANAGIGYETTRILALSGAHVILACRNLEKANSAIESICSSSSSTTTDLKLSSLHLDLASFESVRKFSSEIIKQYKHIDILILNGGVMGVKHEIPEQHLKINHTSHALLTLLLLPYTSRVIFVSSLMSIISDLTLDDLHFKSRKYNWCTAYANSKLCMLLFMYAINCRLLKKDICSINAVHPGESASDVARYLSPFSSFMHKKIIGPLFLLSVAHSARTSVYAAGSMNNDVLQGGLFLHRISEHVKFPKHLTSDSNIQHVWQFTLKEAGITDNDLIPLQSLLDLR